MSFGNQSLDGFIGAAEQAGELLHLEGVKTRSKLALEEGLAMQAISNILTSKDSFYGYEIVKIMNRKSGTVYPMLNKFENPYGLTTSAYEDTIQTHAGERPPRRYYNPTDFGRTVFGLFIPKK
jgi:hypothetical protein